MGQPLSVVFSQALSATGVADDIVLPFMFGITHVRIRLRFQAVRDYRLQQRLEQPVFGQHILGIGVCLLTKKLTAPISVALLVIRSGK